MSFPKYPKYKHSGIEWLGAVPEHWEICRADALLGTTRDTIEADTLSGQQVFHYSIPVVQESGDGQLEDGTEIDSSKHIVSEPQVLVSKLNPRKGTVCIATPKTVLTVCSGEFVPLIPRGAKIRFVWHLVKTNNYRMRLESMVESATRSHQRVLPSDVLRFRWAFPPLSEQTAIATFLDAETSKTDALIAEQRRLIELLKEKRQAVISHAVTKGLNPDALMKASGIEWLGDVPEHCGVTKAKRVASVFVPQRNKPELNDIADGVCWITMEQMQNREIAVSPLYVSEEALADAGSKVLKSGAVIASCVGRFEVATINRVDVIINQQLQAYIPGPKINPGYLRLLILLSSSYFEQTGTAATIVYVNQKGFDELPVVVPPMREQLEIVDCVDVQLETFSLLKAEAARGIELLQERRTALISAAVTGKIDVREFANVEAA